MQFPFPLNKLITHQITPKYSQCTLKLTMSSVPSEVLRDYYMVLSLRIKIGHEILHLQSGLVMRGCTQTQILNSTQLLLEKFL